MEISSYLFLNPNHILCIYLLVYLNYHQIFNLSYWTYCKWTILATWLWQIVYRNEIKRDKKLKIFSYYAAAAINGKIILLSGCFAVRSLPQNALPFNWIHIFCFHLCTRCFTQWHAVSGRENSFLSLPWGKWNLKYFLKHIGGYYTIHVASRSDI